MNARGIPTAVYEVVHMLSYPRRGVGTLDGGGGVGNLDGGWRVGTLDRG